jgi:hypothetical protein
MPAEVEVLLSCRVLPSGYVLGLLFYPEDGGSKFIRKVGKFLPDSTASHPRR